jgi:tape measure domain-containing protein
VLKQVIRGVISEIKMLASASFGAAVELQTLTVRMDNLIAMQVRNAGMTTSYSKSIQIASGYTQELLTWIQKLALATPVSLEDISNMVYLGLAMGWSVTGAKTLTKAIVDYTAAIGMGSEISERIIYNFAQMKQQGKVTGTELRDLGRGAYMPINEILKIMYGNLVETNKEMGKTTMSFAQFTEEAAAGKQPVEDFFKAFEDFVATNMPDMAYKMNYTFKAVRQNVQDLFKILMGWNVLGPAIASITKPLQDFIDKLKTVKALAEFKAIGLAIANVVNSIRQGFSYISLAVQNVVASLHLPAMSIENIVKSIMKFGFTLREIGVLIMNVVNKYILPITTKIGDKFSSDFSSMSKDFFDWGANLIFSFAQGMVKAAVAVLTAAMNFIANILTNWLSPGSPPKILPDIDKWGMETINEWLHGFTQADFSILNDMQGVIKDALGALVNLGVITDVQSSEEYLSISLDLIQAMDELNRTGTISASIFERLASIGGVFGQEIAELLQLQLDYNEQLVQQAIFEQAVADATRIAEQAQVDYDNAVKATQVSAGKTNNLIREYNKMLRKGADKNVLKDKLKLINLSEIELKAARKAEEDKKNSLDIAQEQLQLAKDSLEAFKEALIPLQDAIELQKTLIQTLVDLAQAQKDASTAASGGAGSVAELTDAIDNLSDAFGGGGGKGWKIDFDALKRAAETEWIGLMNGMKTKWADMWSANVGAGSPFSNALYTLKTAWDIFAESIHLPSWEEIMKAWNANPQPPRPNKGPKEPDANIPKVSTLTQRFQAVLDAFAEDIRTNGGILATLGMIANNLFINLRNAIVAKFNELNTSENQNKVMTAINNFMTFLTDLILKPEKIIKGEPTPWYTRIGETIIGWIKTETEKAVDSINWGSILVWIGSKLLSAISLIPSWREIGMKIVQLLGGGMIELIAIMDWKGMWSDVVNGVDDLKTKLGIKWDSIKSKATETWDNIKTHTQTVSDTIKEYISTKIEEIRNNWSAKWGEIKTKVINIWNDIKTHIKTVSDTIKGYIDDLLWGENGILTKFNSIYDSAVTAGRNIVQGIIDGINLLIGNLSIVIADLISRLPAWMQKYLTSGILPTPPKTSPKKAKGGPVTAGISYLIGEKGPELFVPKMSGFIYPNNMISKMLNTIQAPMNATPIYGGNTVNFTGDVHITDNAMSWAVFKAQVQRAIIEG